MGDSWVVPLPDQPSAFALMWSADPKPARLAGGAHIRNANDKRSPIDCRRFLHLVRAGRGGGSEIVSLLGHSAGGRPGELAPACRPAGVNSDA